MLNKIKSILRPIKNNYISRQNYKKLLYISQRVENNNEAVGTNDGKKYLIITGMGMDKVGIFCDIQAFIRWIAFAEEIGDYVPVIDMKYVPNSLIEDDEIGKINGWEYYFEQVSKASIEEAHASDKKLIVNMLDNPPGFSKSNIEIMKRLYNEDWVKNREIRAKWKDLWNRYFRMTDELSNYIESWWYNNVKDDEKVLGVRVRGSDYTAIKPHGHSVQPNFEQVCEQIDRIISSYHVDRIYFATEDEKLINEFDKKYHDKAIFIDGTRIEIREDEIALEAFKRLKVSRKQQGMEYIATIALLGKCDYIISSISNATPYIFLMKDGEFEDEYVFDLGVYE